MATAVVVPPSAIVDEAPPAGPEAIEFAAEVTLVRDALIGIGVGMVVCAGIWALLVLIAMASTDAAIGPAVWMGAGVGLFAGAFYGGWVGTMVGARKLEVAEHATLPPVPDHA
jgi:hypothetical protein